MIYKELKTDLVPRPDRCDGTYDAFCDTSREYTNITAILKSYGKTALLAEMDTYWKDYAGDDESFWEHEWNKHGTCISTFDTECYTDYTGQAEVADYFEKSVELYKGLDSYTVRLPFPISLSYFLLGVKRKGINTR